MLSSRLERTTSTTDDAFGMRWPRGRYRRDCSGARGNASDEFDGEDAPDDLLGDGPPGTGVMAAVWDLSRLMLLAQISNWSHVLLPRVSRGLVREKAMVPAHTKELVHYIQY